jgi:methylenetetrahydrofolate reductase (NADPH)
VSGVHVMAYRQEELIAEIIQQSGVLGHRTPWNPSQAQPSER